MTATSGAFWAYGSKTGRSDSRGLSGSRKVRLQTVVLIQRRGLSNEGARHEVGDSLTGCFVETDGGNEGVGSLPIEFEHRCLNSPESGHFQPYSGRKTQFFL